MSSREAFESFINVYNRCLVEPIENYGKSIENNNYYWKDVRVNFPHLWPALQRIKVYRHENLHLELNAATESELQKYLNRDFDGKRLSQLQEPYFALQQAVVDELFVAIQLELDRLS